MPKSLLSYFKCAPAIQDEEQLVACGISLSSWLYSLWITRIAYFSFANQFLSIERVSPQTYIHDTLVRTIEFTENMYIFCCLQDFWHRKPQRKHSLCFTEYISKIRIFTLKIAKFSFAKCIYTVNLPKLPAAKVSLYTVHSVTH